MRRLLVSVFAFWAVLILGVGAEEKKFVPSSERLKERTVEFYRTLAEKRFNDHMRLFLSDHNGTITFEGRNKRVREMTETFVTAGSFEVTEGPEVMIGFRPDPGIWLARTEVRGRFRQPGIPNLVITLRDVWIWNGTEGGDWYFVPDDELSNQGVS